MGQNITLPDGVEDNERIRRRLIQRKKRIRNARIRSILLLVAAAVILYVTLFSPIFYIKHINVEGNGATDEAAIVSAMSLNKTSNYFRTNTDKCAANIAQLPYIRTVDISKKWPSTLNVTVTECPVAAQVPRNGQYAYIDEYGKVLEYSGIKRSVPEITGVEVGNNIVPGQALRSPEVIPMDEADHDEAQISSYGIAASLKLVRALMTYDALEDVSRIYVEDGALTLIYKRALKVVMGSVDDVEYKVSYMLRIIKELGDEPAGKLDLSLGSNAFYSEHVDDALESSGDETDTTEVVDQNEDATDTTDAIDATDATDAPDAPDAPDDGDTPTQNITED